ncbi:putative Chymotrypsin-C [Hypsibius exemplaris]|uniref:Chymotrypsin-C n=1 Tax=Hypsibius exemplaris TaxID=2072580 RepID=A0A9X6NE12_HYPEX|nr:putative Chymotrypsin-C [Hypsibius exemplaris]
MWIVPACQYPFRLVLFFILSIVCQNLMCQTTTDPGADDDFGDYTFDEDPMMATGPIDPAIQPNASVPTPSLLSPAVIGGNPVKPHKYPFMVGLQYRKDNFHLCGGSLITPMHVLTAAHCVVHEENYRKLSSPANLIHVGVGMHNRLPNSRNHYFDVKRILVHHKYRGQSNGFLYDIALLTLSTSVRRRPSLKAGIIRLPAGPANDPPPQTAVRGIGWGLTKNITKNNPESDTPLLLMGADFRVLTNRDCTRRALGSPIAASQICIDSSNRAMCSGDSGGPLFRQLPSGQYELVGLASYIMGQCQERGSANVFTGSPTTENG